MIFVHIFDNSWKFWKILKLWSQGKWTSGVATQLLVWSQDFEGELSNLLKSPFLRYFSRTGVFFPYSFQIPNYNKDSVKGSQYFFSKVHSTLWQRAEGRKPNVYFRRSFAPQTTYVPKEHDQPLDLQTKAHIILVGKQCKRKLKKF